MFLNEEYSIERYSTYSRGAGGERIETWSTHLDLLVSFQERTGDKSILDTSQDGFRKTFRMYVESSTDIINSDRIVDTNTTTLIYEILTINDQFGHHLEIDCRITE